MVGPLRTEDAEWPGRHKALICPERRSQRLFARRSWLDSPRARPRDARGNGREV